MEIAKLYDYQNEIKKQVYEQLKHHQKVVLGCPTGGGKTVIFSSIACDGIRNNRKVVILVDTEELVFQTIDTLCNMFGIQKNKILAFTADKKISVAQLSLFNIVVAMAQTVRSRQKSLQGMFDSFNLCIIDEAHMRTFNKLLTSIPANCKVIGVTATPMFPTKKDPMSNYYGSLIYPYQVIDMIEFGSVVPANYKIVGGLQEKNLSKNNKGEFTEKSQQIEFKRSKVYKGLEKQIDTNKQYLWFCAGVEHATERYQQLSQQGYAVGLILGNTTKVERKQTLNLLKCNKLDIIVNCGCLTKGIDYKQLGGVVLERAINSLNLYIQICGRGGRSAKGKTYFDLIDGGGNYERHKMFELKRNWQELFARQIVKKPKPKLELEVPKVYRCDNCLSIILEKFDVCPKCGHEVEAGKKKVLHESDEVVNFQYVKLEIEKEINGKYIKDLNFYQVYSLYTLKKYKRGFIFRLLRNLGFEALLEFAHLEGFQKPLGWANKQMEFPTNLTNFKIKL